MIKEILESMAPKDCESCSMRKLCPKILFNKNKCLYKLGKKEETK